VGEARAKAEVIGTHIFQLYANLLSDESCQPWDKIVKAQMESAPQEDLKGELYSKKGGKTWESFLPCMIFHLLTMFQHNLGKAVKYYITKTLKKTNQVLLQQFFK